MGLYDATLGALLIGVFFNTFLYGLVIYQFAIYYHTKFNDSLATKCMVFFLFLLDTFHSASAIFMMWDYAVTNYDNPEALTSGGWAYQITSFCTSLAAIVTQMYLGLRIWRLTNRKFLFGVVIVLSSSSLILGFVCGVEALINHDLSEMIRIVPIAIAFLTTQVVVDVFITTTLVIIFTYSRTGFHNTDTVLKRLIRGAIQTGLFTGIFSLSNLICFIALPKTYLNGTFAIPIGRIYTNTLMDSLISRKSLRAELFASHNMTEGLPSINWAALDRLRGTSGSHSASGQVQVAKTFEEMRDSSARSNAQGSRALPV